MKCSQNNGLHSEVTINKIHYESLESPFSSFRTIPPPVIRSIIAPMDTESHMEVITAMKPAVVAVSTLIPIEENMAVMVAAFAAPHGKAMPMSVAMFETSNTPPKLTDSPRARMIR